MTTVGAYELKTHVGELLDKVEKGESIAITRHGVQIATLVPAPGKVQQDIDETVAAIREARKGKSLGGLSIRQLIEEGRRF